MYEKFIQQHPFFVVVADAAASCSDIIFCGMLYEWANNSWLTHILRENMKKRQAAHIHTSVNKLNVRRVNHNINYMMIMF